MIYAVCIYQSVRIVDPAVFRRKMDCGRSGSLYRLSESTASVSLKLSSTSGEIEISRVLPMKRDISIYGKDQILFRDPCIHIFSHGTQSAYLKCTENAVGDYSPVL